MTVRELIQELLLNASLDDVVGIEDQDGCPTLVFCDTNGLVNGTLYTETFDNEAE